MEILLTAFAVMLSTAATGFAAWELRANVRDRQRARRVETEGVAVVWRPSSRPNHAEPSGRATWIYEITAQNPGQLPIRDVTVSLSFPVDVRRRHSDGALDRSERVVTMGAPGILGGQTRVWRRHLEMEFSAADTLATIGGQITFTTADGEHRTNYMDGRPSTISKGLR